MRCKRLIAAFALVRSPVIMVASHANAKYPSSFDGRGAVGLALLLSCVLVACSSGTTVNRTDDKNRELKGTVPVTNPWDSTDIADEDLYKAQQFFETVDLPDEPIPEYLMELQRLHASCMEALGFPIDDRLNREAAFKTGGFVWYVGDQVERFDQAIAACHSALDELGISLGTGREANEELYQIYMDSQECLKLNGFPTVDPPTRESFIEDPSTWYPWQALLPINTGFTPDDELINSNQFRPYMESLEVCPRP